MRLRERLLVTWTSATTVVTALLYYATRGRAKTSVDLKPGDPAPDFSLPASDGRTYQLSEFSGRTAVVIAWFPKAFTGGCTAECQSIGANRKALLRFKVAYFGANLDSPETNRRFAHATGMEFPILSDRGAAVARAYGVLGPGGLPARWTFYIGADRRILAIDKHVRWRTHGTDIETALTALLPESDA